MNNKKLYILLCVILITAGGNLHAQIPDWKPSVAVIELTGSLYVLVVNDDPSGGVVNSLLSIGPDGILIVDHAGNWQDMTVSKEIGDIVISKIKELSNSDGIPDFIINTHWHGDHTGANLLWGDQATIIAQANTHRRLSEQQTPFWAENPLGPLPEVARPDITFSDSLTLHLNGNTIKVYNFGTAHTDGDAIIYFKEAGILHMGDLYHGHNVVAPGADARGLLNTYQSILDRIPKNAKEATRFVTGHGGISNYKDFAIHTKLYEDVIAFIDSEVGKGTPKDEIMVLPLPEPWEQEWNVDDQMKATLKDFILNSRME